MAKRGSSDITSQLGSFLRTTLQQLDTVGKVVVQKGKAGKIQFDLTMLRRKRKDALAALGEVTARLAAEGRLSDDDFPELSRPLADLETMDERIDAEERRARAAAAGLPDDLEMPDFDEAARRASRDAEEVEEYDEPEAGGEDLGAAADEEAGPDDEDAASAADTPKTRPGR